MKTRLIDSGIYRETLRCLRMPALVMLILATVFDAFPLLMKILERDHEYISAFTDVHALLCVIPFVAPLLLTVMAFRFQTRRCDSDFYHALPYTRTTLSLSMLSAVATWCAVLVVGSSLIVALLCIPFSGNISAATIALDIASSFTACLFMAFLTFLAVSLCGNTVSVIFAVFILLLAPYLISSSLLDAVVSRVRILPYDDAFLNFTQYNLLYGGYDTVQAWVGTLLLLALCLGLGLWMNKRRPSETAGSPTVTPALQIVLRLLLSLTCCLPAIGIVLDAVGGYRVDISEIVFLYLLAMIAYFLYELFTTKKAKNLLKAIPWLGMLAALNIVCIVLVPLSCRFIASVSPDAEDVDSVSLTALISSEQLKNHSLADSVIYYNTEGNKALATEQPVLPEDYEAFHSYALRYENSDCGDVRLTDDTSKEIICERLDELCELLEDNNYTIHNRIKLEGVNREWCVYQVEVAIRQGAVTHHRILWLFDSELSYLLGTIDRQAELPSYFYKDAVYPIVTLKDDV